MKELVRLWLRYRPSYRFRALVLFSLISCLSMMAQDKSVTGTVVDSQNEPLPGTSVVVKGKTTGTITDVNGKFTIKVSENDILVFSSIGYVSQEVAVAGKSVINVTMGDDVQEITELVVIGYGVQKKSDVTGAVASVSAGDIAKTQSVGIVTAMQGRAAGVMVSQNSGAPGSNTNVRIRGISSFNGTEPLWVVDGVPSSANSVSPNDIQSIEILKDASTSAIYGSQGANGVVLITTKKGNGQAKPSASLNYYHSWTKAGHLTPLTNGQEFSELQNQITSLGAINNTAKAAAYESLGTSAFAPANQVPDGVTYNYDPSTVKSYDHYDDVFRQAQANNVEFSLAGGSDKASAYFSANYLNQTGIVYNSEYEKLNLRLNTDYKVNDWLKFGENGSFTYSRYDGFREWQLMGNGSEYHSPILAAQQYSPTVNAYRDNYTSTDSMWNSNGSAGNPRLKIDLLDHWVKNYSGNISFYTEVTPLKGLVFKSILTGGFGFGDEEDFTRPYFLNASTNQDYTSLTQAYNNNNSWNWQNTVTYNTTFFDNINFSALLGQESGYTYYKNASVTVRDLIDRSEEMRYLSASQNDSVFTPTPSGSGGEYAGYAYFGRVSADYKGMILGQYNIRQDYSSRFGPDQRSGIFPSWSLGFKFTELEFFKDMDWLSFGKVRIGYGEAGNTPPGLYAYYATIGGSGLSSYGYAMGNNSSLAAGAAPNKLANTAIHWEHVITSNIGADFAFLRNKLTFTVDRFARTNDGMLMYANNTGTAGWLVRSIYQENGGVDQRAQANIGKLNSKGFEFTLGYKDQVGEFKYDVSANLTYVKTKAVDLNGTSYFQGSAKNPGSTFCRTIEGEEVGNFYGLKIEKIFQKEDCDTFYLKTGTATKYQYKRVIKATNGNKIIGQVSSYMGYNTKTKQRVYSQGSAAGDTMINVYLQNDASAGDFKFVDQNNDGKIDADDYVNLGSPFAPWQYGITINLEYKGFDLNMFWQGVYGNKIFNTTKFYQNTPDGQFNWSKDFYNNYYRDELVNASGAVIVPARYSSSYPRLDPYNSNQNLSQPSEFYVEDGSYLRLKNLQLGYTLPDQYSKYVGLTSLRFYVAATNLLTFTKYSGLDPDVEQSNVLQAGIDRGTYPVGRSFTVGVNLKF